MVLLTTNPDTLGDGHFLFGPYDPNLSGENIVLLATTVALVSGTMLGRTITGTPTVAAVAAVSGSGGTPGNGAVGSLTADAGAPEGAYTITILNPAANAGAFEVRKPDRSLDGYGTVGVAYNGTINFTLADGSTDFVEDDRITVNVSYADYAYRYGALDPAAVNGLQNFAAILFGRREISTVTQRAAGVVRDQGVNGNLITYPNAMTTAQKAKAEDQARDKGIIIRR
jgi:hypothetical protein